MGVFPNIAICCISSYSHSLKEKHQKGLDRVLCGGLKVARIPEHEVERLKREVSVERLAEARGIKLIRHEEIRRRFGTDEITPNVFQGPRRIQVIRGSFVVPNLPRRTPGI
jgi:hypothetical protein